ncbi:Uncharacterised protein [Mycobacteroides abscessus subsp. massiliense]|nr:Uncharacterised protein [Mycobacteroides abscessus subsp. massiliense]
MHVNAGEVNGPAGCRRVELGGGQRTAIRPPRFVPAMAPDHLVGMLPRVCGQPVQALFARGHIREVEPDEG